MKSVQMSATIGKMKITNTKNPEDLKGYSRFESVKDFDNNWEKIMVVYKKKFTKLQLDILRFYRQFGGQEDGNPGVCNASYKRLREAWVKEYGPDNVPDRKTFYLTIKKAEKYGILHIAEGWRENNSRSANVVIFARAEDVIPNALRQEIEDKKALQERLDREFQANQAILNFGAIQRAAYAERQRKKAEAEAAAAQKAAQEEAAAKRVTLSRRIKEYLQAKKMNVADGSEYSKILYGTIKKRMAADAKLSKEQAEQIAWKSFMVVMNLVKDKKIENNPFAALSAVVARQFDNLYTKYSQAEFALKQATGKTEIVPEWYGKPAKANYISQEEQDRVKAEMLAKIGQ